MSRGCWIAYLLATIGCHAKASKENGAAFTYSRLDNESSFHFVRFDRAQQLHVVGNLDRFGQIRMAGFNNTGAVCGELSALLGRGTERYALMNGPGEIVTAILARERLGTTANEIAIVTLPPDSGWSALWQSYRFGEHDLPVVGNFVSCPGTDHACVSSSPNSVSISSYWYEAEGGAPILWAAGECEDVLTRAQGTLVEMFRKAATQSPTWRDLLQDIRSIPTVERVGPIQ